MKSESAESAASGGAPKRLIIWGSKGHARVIRLIAQAQGYELLATIDNDPAADALDAQTPLFIGRRGLEQCLEVYGAEGVEAAVAIGGQSGAARLEIYDLMERYGLRPATLIHENAYVAPDAIIAEGVQIMAGAVVAAEAEVGRGTILNHNSTFDHESVCGPGCHLAPGVTVCGCVDMGARVFIGAGATVFPRMTLGDDTTVGAGSVVNDHVLAGMRVWGVPARLQPSV